MNSQTRSGEAGFTLAVFAMVIAVMAIMMAIAVQEVSYQMQREREAELIFRGQQYVEAIRIYKQKYGRYPMRMKELWEADPKVLRKKWEDPMPPFREWDVIFLGEEGQGTGGANVRGSGGRQPTPTRTPVFERSREGGEGERVGPIIGVRSRTSGKSFKVYEGRTNYREWKFTFKEQQARIPRGGRPGAGGTGGSGTGSGTGTGGTGTGQGGDSPWGMPPTPPPGRYTPRPTPPNYPPGPTGTPNR